MKYLITDNPGNEIPFAIQIKPEDPKDVFQILGILNGEKMHEELNPLRHALLAELIALMEGNGYAAEVESWIEPRFVTQGHSYAGGQS